MSRNDSILNTGATSAAFASKKAKEVKRKREDDQKERQDKQLQLKPVYGAVIEPLIQKHKNSVKSIEEFEVEKLVEDDHFKSEIMARKKFMQFLNLFDQEIKIALKSEKIEQGDKFEESNG